MKGSERAGSRDREQRVSVSLARVATRPASSPFRHRLFSRTDDASVWRISNNNLQTPSAESSKSNEPREENS